MVQAQLPLVFFRGRGDLPHKAELNSKRRGQAVAQRGITAVAIEVFDSASAADVPLAIDKHLVVQREIDRAGVQRGAVQGNIHKQRVAVARAGVLAIDPALFGAETMAQVNPLTRLLRQQGLLINAFFSEGIVAGSELAAGDVRRAQREQGIDVVGAIGEAAAQQQLFQIAA